MAIAQQTPPAEMRPPSAPPARNGRWSGFASLLMARMPRTNSRARAYFLDIRLPTSTRLRTWHCFPE